MFVYQLFIGLFGLGIRIGSLFNRKAQRWIHGRKDWKNQTIALANRLNRPVLIHCASLGEYEMARPLIRHLHQSELKNPVIVSFFSPSGYDNAKMEEGAEAVYLPLDTLSNVRFFIDHINPAALVFVKYDLWFNLIEYSSAKGCRLILFNYHPKPGDFHKLFFGKWLIAALGKFHQIFVVNTQSKVHLSKLGIKPVDVGGDSRYENVLRNTAFYKPDELIRKFSEGFENVVVCGSIWAEDWELIRPAIDHFKNWCWILAPHEVHKKDIGRLLGKYSVAGDLTYYSDLADSTNGGGNSRVLILDCIGKLFSSYGLAGIAYVGGAFRTGLHNILEPAAFGVPVAFGPKYHKFPEADEFIRKKIGRSINDSGEFILFANDAVRRDGFLSSAEIIEKMSEMAGKSEGVKDSIVSIIGASETKS